MDRGRSRRRDPRPGGVGTRGARALRRAHRAARRTGQLGRDVGSRSGAGGGARRRRSGARGREARPAARRADDDQGHVPDRGLHHHVRCAPAGDVRPDRGRLAGRPPARRRRDPVRQDQRADLRRRHPDLQRRLRHDQQPARREPHIRRLVGRVGGGAVDGIHPDRARLRHRRFDPAAVALVRGDGAQAELRDRAGARPDPRHARHAHTGRSQRRGADGAVDR